MPETDPPEQSALCVDGPMAGTEFTLSASAGEIPLSIDVSGVPYALGVQSHPVPGRNWRYHVDRWAEDDADRRGDPRFELEDRGLRPPQRK